MKLVARICLLCLSSKCINLAFLVSERQGRELSNDQKNTARLPVWRRRPRELALGSQTSCFDWSRGGVLFRYTPPLGQWKSPIWKSTRPFFQKYPPFFCGFKKKNPNLTYLTIFTLAQLTVKSRETLEKTRKKEKANKSSH